SAASEKKTRPPRRGAKLALATADLDDVDDKDDREGFAGFYDDDEELVSEDDDDSSLGGKNRFGLQFEHVVPEGAYGVDPEDGILMNPLASKEGEDAEYELALPDRWWLRTRREFFRHDMHSYRMIEGQWKRVQDPRGPHFAPRKRHRPREQKKEERLRREMKSGRE
ncbi:unnamed protein product, partial [Polarella glacialis]